MQLQSIMSDATTVAPHEWYRHGTCSGVTPAAYFGNAISLTEQVRQTLDPVFEAAAGGHLSAGLFVIASMPNSAGGRALVLV